MNEDLKKIKTPDTRISPLTQETDGKGKILIQALWEEWPNYFEKIDLLSWIDEKKLEKLQQSDLVLVYRDNDRYRAMSDALKDLVEQKYWWKVYCITIPQGTEKLSDKEMELLKNILNTCNYMADNTVNRILRNSGIKLNNPIIKFDTYNEYDTINRRKRDTWIFLKITENLEKKFKEKWINTVYIYISEIDPDCDVNYTCYDHWCMCKSKDWEIYFDPEWIEEDTSDDEIKNKLDGLKMFWESVFPRLNVQFLENVKTLDFSKYESEWLIWFDNNDFWTLKKMKHFFPEFDVDNYKEQAHTDLSNLKPGWAILIADRHSSLKDFSGKIIEYAWNSFESKWWIEDFINVGEQEAEYIDNAGKRLAEEIMTKTFGEKTPRKQD